MSAQTHNESSKDDHGKGSDETGRPVTFIVNAREHTTSAKTMPFEQVVALAFPDTPSGPNVLFTVSYRRGQGNKPEGSLLAGDSVKVKDGMVFVVSATDKS
ncbi:multiubiquitin domain-containing protein [Aquipuribacter hungaricus]|uniref:Multiubiquitin domain-containing protein n=1 Tax=Aquipuribacter hungaricus TaxID=545624 RepID=A0ABV7WIU6_9MICO